MTRSHPPTPEPHSPSSQRDLNSAITPIPGAQNDPTESGGEATWSLATLLGIARRKFLILAVLALLTSTFMVHRASKRTVEYQGSFQLLVEPVDDKHELAQLTENGTKTELDYSTQIEVMFSPQTLKPILQQINKQYPELDYSALSGRLSITRLGETKIIQVSYRDGQSDRVKFVLQKLSEGYLQYRAAAQRNQLQQGLTFVEMQIPKVREKANTLQQQIQALRKQYNFMDPDSYGELLSNRLGSITQQRQAVQADLLTLQKQYELLKKQPANSNFNQSLNYQRLLQESQLLQQMITLESNRFTSESPNLRQLLEKQASLQRLMDQEARKGMSEQLNVLANQVQILQVREKMLVTTEQSLSQQLADFPVISRQFMELQQELKIATEGLQRLQETQARLQIQSAQNEIPWQLIAPPTPPQSKPPVSLIRNLITGIIVGTALGFALAYFLEKLENTYYTIAELKKGSRIPLLGIIPYHPLLQDLQPELYHFTSPLEEQQPEQTTHDFTEAFRSLYANLQRLELRSNILAISSALPAEGRTTLALHLAQAAAAMGQRVLLVDAHLRRSGVQIHTALGLPNKEGLSQLLTAQTSLERALQQIAWEPGLYVISMGSPATDPTRLLSSEAMKEMTGQLGEKFNLVIFDMPPLTGLADVNLIASNTAGVLLVTALGQRGSATALTEALDQLRLAHLPVLGLVANKVKNYKVDLYH